MRTSWVEARAWAKESPVGHVISVAIGAPRFDYALSSPTQPYLCLALP